MMKLPSAPSTTQYHVLYHEYLIDLMDNTWKLGSADGTKMVLYHHLPACTSTTRSSSGLQEFQKSGTDGTAGTIALFNSLKLVRIEGGRHD